MRYLLIAIYKKAVVWFSIMMIPYCVFSSFLEEYPSLIFIILPLGPGFTKFG